MTSLGWCSGWLRAAIRRAPPPPAPSARSGRSAGRPGELLGWDGPDAGPGSRVPTLRDRLPADLREAPSGPDFAALPFTSLYLTSDEWAAEIVKPDRSRGHAPRLGSGWDRRLPRPDGRPGQAKRAARDRLHGRDPAVPAPDRLPAGAAGDRAGLAGAPQRSGAGSRVAQMV